MILSSGESSGLSWLGFPPRPNKSTVQAKVVHAFCMAGHYGWKSHQKYRMHTLFVTWPTLCWSFRSHHNLCMSFKFPNTFECVRQLSDMLFNMLLGRNLDIYLSRATGAGKRHLLPCLSTLALALQMNTPSLQPPFSCHEPWASTEIYTGFLSTNSCFPYGSERAVEMFGDIWNMHLFQHAT